MGIRLGSGAVLLEGGNDGGHEPTGKVEKEVRTPRIAGMERHHLHADVRKSSANGEVASEVVHWEVSKRKQVG